MVVWLQPAWPQGRLLRLNDRLRVDSPQPPRSRATSTFWSLLPASWRNESQRAKLPAVDRRRRKGFTGRLTGSRDSPPTMSGAGIALPSHLRNVIQKMQSEPDSPAIALDQRATVMWFDDPRPPASSPGAHERPFDTFGAAVRFVIEELPTAQRASARIDVAGASIDIVEIETIFRRLPPPPSRAAD